MSILIALVLICQKAATYSFNVKYETIYNDEIHLIGARYARSDNEGNIGTLANRSTHVLDNTTENPFQGVIDEDDLVWVGDALKDIAYFLRSHKFNEYDIRYEKHQSKAPKEYYLLFPKPPLRSLHWEVNKFCEPSFLTCVDYLRKKIRNTGLRREDDTSIVIQEQSWNNTNHSQQINAVEKECRKMLESDNKRADPFQGPLERFQWRVTASYFMCWYTMNGVPNLSNLNEKCDNFASCLDPKFGPNNQDPRADSGKDFSCSLYSFCPDPCCPLKHVKDFSECWDHEKNPCYAANKPGHRQCLVDRSQNTGFTDIILNKWNVTCHCPEKGFVWDSRYGICVDVDECLSDLHKCQNASESCINSKGSFECACNWGYSWTGSKCKPSPALNKIKLQKYKPTNGTQAKMASSIIKRLFHMIWDRGDEDSGSKRLMLQYYTFIIIVTSNCLIGN